MKFGRRDSNLFASPPPGDDMMPPEPAALPSPMPVMAVAAAPATAQRTAPRAVSNELNAFLGKGCIYEGKLTFEGRVRIDGRFTGEIFSNDTLEIGPDAEIEAQIDVAAVVIAGRVTGNVNARGRCDLRAPAIVVGNVTSPVITMQEGVQFDGNMTMSGSVDQAVRANTKRAPMARVEKHHHDAPPSRDPSDLMNPVP